MLGGIAPKANKMELAKQMLRELAETQSAVLSNEIFDRADELGISKRTLETQRKSWVSGQEKSTTHGTGNWIK